MPIFEFECTNCGHTFEFLRLSTKDKIPKRCPKCQHKIEQVVGRTSWMYTKGKNKNWPIAESSDDGKPSTKEYD